MISKIKLFISLIYFFNMSFGTIYIYSQDFSQAKKAIQIYINSWFIDSTNINNNDWFIKVDGMKFPKKGLEYGLKTLEENLKAGKISKSERKQIQQQYITTYINQSVILAETYKDLLNNSELDLLLQEFLQQAATQIWLDKQMKKNPHAAVPSQNEINKYYKENTERLIQLGLSASQIKEYTEQELRHKKLKEWTIEQLNKVNKNAKVEINPTSKKKLDL